MPRKSAVPATPTPDYEEFVIRVPKTRGRYAGTKTVLRHVLIGVLDVDADDEENPTLEVADRIRDYGACTNLGVIPLYPKGASQATPIIVEIP